ncbi:hypothetical protein P7K49_020790, partial [Saguinus oedipus]
LNGRGWQLETHVHLLREPFQGNLTRIGILPKHRGGVYRNGTLQVVACIPPPSFDREHALPPRPHRHPAPSPAWPESQRPGDRRREKVPASALRTPDHSSAPPAARLQAQPTSMSRYCRPLASTAAPPTVTPTSETRNHPGP